MDWGKVSELLSQPLDPKHVSKPSGPFGPKGDYIEAWHAISEANRIFGPEGWSYTIALTKDDIREVTDSKGNPQWQAAYTCVCRLTVDGVVREDVGFGSGFAKAIGDAIEGATKEAVSDALKRCLRTFGWPFGLALYQKPVNGKRDNVQAPEVKATPESERNRLKSAILAQGTAEKVKKLYGQSSFVAAFNLLPAPMQNEVAATYSRVFDALSIAEGGGGG